jgi:NitT/TauT family transport system permease protein
VFGEGAGNTALVFVTIIMLTVVGILAYGSVVLLEKKVLHYIPKKDYAPV